MSIVRVPFSLTGGGLGGYVIEGSGLTDDSSSQLNFTPDTPDSRRIMVFDFIAKVNDPRAGYQYVISSYPGTPSYEFAVGFSGGGTVRCDLADSGRTNNYQSLWGGTVAADPSAYYHVVIAIDTTQAVEADRVRVWINGSAASKVSGTIPAQNTDMYAGGAYNHRLLASMDASPNYADLYAARIAWLDNLTITDPETDGFGETVDGGWRINDISGLDFGAIGFLLEGSNGITTGYNSAVADTSYYSADFDGSNDYLSRGASLTGIADSKSMIFSAWVKFDGGDSTDQYLFYVGNAGFRITRNSSNILTVEGFDPSTILVMTSNVTYTADGQWHHILASCDLANTQGWLYIDDVDVLDVGAIFTNSNIAWNTNNAGCSVGASYSGTSKFNGRLAEVYFQDGEFLNLSTTSNRRKFISADLEPVDLGSDGSTPTGTQPILYQAIATGETISDFKTNKGSGGGMTENGTLTAGGAVRPLGVDLSPTGTITATNDSPTDDAANGYGNHATFNLLRTNTISASPTYSNGNRSVTNSAAGSATYSPYTTIVVNAGKFYAEIAPNTFANDEEIIGMALNSWDQWEASNQLGASSGSVGLHTLSTADTKIKINGGTLTTVDTKMASPDRTVLAADVDAGLGWLGFYDDSAGVMRWVDSSGTTRTTDEPGNGTNATWTFTANSVIKFGASLHSGGDVDLYAEEADWVGTAPSGFKALSTANLPAPAVTDPSLYFNTLLYIGNGSTQSITGAGFQPDFVWMKDRDRGTQEHHVEDAVRGATKKLSTNQTADEATSANYLTSFDADGFSVGSDGTVNYSGDNFVAWCLKAGGSGSSNTDGSIPSTVSVADHGGFGILTYTGNGVSGATLGTGMTIPSGTNALAIFKKRSAPNDWHVGYEINGTIGGMELNNTTGNSGVSNAVTNFHSDSGTTITITSGGVVNDTGASYVAYVFQQIPGFCAIGSYTGNGDADGPYVVVDDGASGFKPAFVLIKNIDDSQDWVMFDNARDPYNVVDANLSPNLPNAEDAGTSLDFTANGFKPRAVSDINNNSKTYLYLAFAEYPFGGEGISQARAR
jgi:hypothetical protein